MSLALTILLSLLSAAVLAGRVYEILYLTDMQTGFLLVGGVVLNPYILAVFSVITICCGIIIFAPYKKTDEFYSKSSRYAAALAGAAMIAAGALALETDRVSLFFIAGGLALVIMAICHLGQKKSDYAVMLLLLVFAAGLCMDVVSFDVSTYHNTVFLQNVMSYICIIAFMLAVLKNAYLPGKNSRMVLYIAGVISFTVCTMMSLADIICAVITDSWSVQQLVMNCALAFFGLYAFDTAVSAIPSAKELNAEKKAAEGIVLIETPAETAEASAEDDSSLSAEVQQTETEKDVPKAEESEDTDVIEAEEENQNELTKLFETLAEEKAEKADTETAEDVQTELEISAAETEDTEKDTDKYNMLSEIFSEDGQAEIAQTEKADFGATRSFKAFAQPKLDQSAPEFDMLKSMFKGEDTSQYSFEQKEAENNETKQKRSLFGGVKKEKVKKEKPTAEKQPEKIKTEDRTSGKVKFVASEPKSAKTKEQTKKVVYKKPR